MMLVVKTLGGWSGRWVVVVAAVGLAGVTGWMLAEGDRGVQIAAVLGFPIAVLGVLVAALGLLVAVRGTLVPSPPSPRQRRAERPTSPRWSVRARIALAVGAFVTLAAALAGGLMLTGSTDEPQEPSAADPGLRSLRDADPCLLIDTNALRAFGTPRRATSPWVEGCEVAIDTPNGGEARLRVQFHNVERTTSVYDKKGVDFEGAKDACQSSRVPTDQISVKITAFNRGSKPIDLCAMTRAATTTVDDIIVKNGEIPTTLNRTAGYSHASHNACDTLDHALFHKHGLEQTYRKTGFANWTCFWDMKDGTQVAVFFRLDESDYGTYYGDRREKPGQDAFQDTSERNSCGFYVVHRSGPTATKMFHVTVEGPLTADRRCDLAHDFAFAVEEKLSS